MGTPLGGSAFFLAVPWERVPPYQHVYAVTNRHVLEPRQGVGALVLRLNLKAGGVETVETNLDEWLSPTSGDDIAVRLCHLDQAIFDYGWEPIQMVITDEVIAEQQLGIGDEVFSAGRFLDIESPTGNRPVLRAGQIAAIPPVSVVVTSTRSQESYLVEMRSRTGFSGSAVYAFIDPSSAGQWVQRKGSTLVTKNFQMEYPVLRGPWILGVHWGTMPVAGPDAFDLETRRPASYGSGIAAVVPGQTLRKFILEDERLKKIRREVEAEYLSRPHAVEESASVAGPETDNPSHREDFMRLLGAASKEKPPAS